MTTSPESKKLFAPAPWKSTGNSWQYTTIYDANDRPVCQLDLEDWGVNERNQDALEKEQAKVAALIVVAPELYEALKELLHTSSPPFSREDGAFITAREKALAVLGKAEGRS